jgi:hypothetical protein
MLATMRNEELVGKLIALAEGNLDLVQHAIRTAANGAKAALGTSEKGARHSRRAPSLGRSRREAA